MKIQCIICKTETNHQVLKEVIDSTPPDADYVCTETNRMIQCMGCNSVSLMVETFGEDERNPDTSEPRPTIVYYPPRSSGRSAATEEYCFPTEIRLVYNEVITALNNSLPILAGIGLRALIEAICKEKGANGRNLQNRIDSLETLGVLSNAQAQYLHAHRFLGNIAAYEIVTANPRELVAAFDIAKTLLKTIYVIPKLNNSITTGRPTTS